jgi:hypothetical protein
MSDERQREPMSKVDTAWLRMERPTNLMMITGVLMFAGRLDPKRIRKLIGERFLAFRRFRQRAVQSASGAWWETVDDLDLDWHVQAATLPGKAGKPELEAFVSHLASTSLDHDLPPRQHRDAPGPREAEVGPGEGADRRRRRGRQDAQPPLPRLVETGLIPSRGETSPWCLSFPSPLAVLCGNADAVTA